MSKFLDEYGLSRVYTNIKNYIDSKILTSGQDGETNVYSTTEQKIGTWIDGKPIYRKAIQTTTPNSNSQAIIDAQLTSSYVSKVINIGGSVNASTGNIIPLNAYFSNTDHPAVWVRTNGLNLLVQESQLYNRPANIFIEYTKTTD